jgi:hypothetical protein
MFANGAAQMRRIGFLAVLLAATCTPEQPPPFCTVSRAVYAARYTLATGTGDCAGLKGEVLGAQAYLADPDKAGDLGGLAIQSQAVGQRLIDGEAATPPVVDPDPNHRPFAYGKFSSERPDDAHVCTVPTLSDGEFNQGALTTAMATLPAIAVKYHFTNVKTFVTAANTGVLWGGDLQYTSGTCTASYKVVAISPMVSCADPAGKPDAHLCVAEPDPASGFAGSGLNPDIKVKCDPDLLLCVPAGDFPSL